MATYTLTQGLASVTTDTTLTGAGTSVSPLTIASPLSLLDTSPVVIEAGRIALLSSLGLTKFVHIPVGIIPNTTPTTTPSTGDGAIEGGGVKTTGGATIDFLGRSIFQAVLSGTGSISFRAKIAGPTSGRTAEVGLINAAQGHVFVCMTDFANDATRYIIKMIGASTSVSSNQTIVADTLIHWQRLAWTASTITHYVDNAVNASIAKANLSNEPLYPMMYSSTGGDVTLTDVLYGFVAP